MAFYVLSWLTLYFCLSSFLLLTSYFRLLHICFLFRVSTSSTLIDHYTPRLLHTSLLLQYYTVWYNLTLLCLYTTTLTVTPLYDFYYSSPLLHHYFSISSTLVTTTPLYYSRSLPQSFFASYFLFRSTSYLFLISRFHIIYNDIPRHSLTTSYYISTRLHFSLSILLHCYTAALLFHCPFHQLLYYHKPVRLHATTS